MHQIIPSGNTLAADPGRSHNSIYSFIPSGNSSIVDEQRNQRVADKIELKEEKRLNNAQTVVEQKY